VPKESKGPLEMKGIVRPPYEMPTELTEKKRNIVPEATTPLLIRLFTALCFFRSAVFLIFGLIMGLAPDSGVAAFLAANYDPFPKQISPEMIFYFSSALYAFIGWRWYCRDWKARWVVMFMSGAVALRTIVILAADHAVGNPLLPLTPVQYGALIVGIAFNLTICGYLAFYPGMDQAFKETSD
jgi:hypothetical protein